MEGIGVTTTPCASYARPMPETGFDHDHDRQQRLLTWSALLAQWTEFSQAALALPTDGEGGRWRAAVPHVVTLQAVTHALGELDRVAPDEQPLALDRAELAIREAAAGLSEAWRSVPMPEEVGEIIGDARRTLELIASAGVEIVLLGDRLIVSHPGELCAMLEAAEFTGELMLPCPGVPLFAGTPAVFIDERPGVDPDESLVEALLDYLAAGVVAPARGPAFEIASPAAPRQAYRQFDFAVGGPVRDYVVLRDSEMPAGQPLLVMAMSNGEVLPVPLGATRGAASAVHMDPLPIEFAPDAQREEDLA